MLTAPGMEASEINMRDNNHTSNTSVTHVEHQKLIEEEETSPKLKNRKRSASKKGDKHSKQAIYKEGNTSAKTLDNPKVFHKEKNMEEVLGTQLPHPVHEINSTVEAAKPLEIPFSKIEK
jgi:hypothetical protein